MAVKRVPERHQAAAIGLGTCQLHNLSRFDILLNFIMIRQDHLMGSPGMWNPYTFVPSEQFVMEFHLVPRLRKYNIGHPQTIFSGLMQLTVAI